MKKYILELTIFVCGAAIMALEMVASRIMAPHFGTSNMIWTSIIGIILFSNSLGAYIGGLISDKKPEQKVITFIVILAGIWILLLPLINPTILQFIKTTFKDIRIGAILSATTLFLIPSILLGTISPFAIKLKIKDLNTTGEIAGGLSAIATFGSIVGTFASGFLLIPILGSNQILYLIGIILILLGFFIYVPEIKKVVITIILAILIVTSGYSYTKTLAKDRLVELDSEYGRIAVYDTTYSSGIIRTLKIDNGYESAMYLHAPSDLVFSYVKYYDLMNYFNSNIENTLMIGGGAYSYPKYYLNKYPERKIDVVEIDSKVTEIAKKYFYLKEDDKMQIFHEDGRAYLNNNTKKYDTILNDAFKGTVPPFQLTTKEAVQKIYNSLNSEGVYLTNIIGSLEGEKDEFFLTEVNTIKSVFPNVYVFVCGTPNNIAEVQNIMIIASKYNSRKEIKLTGNDEIDTMLKNYVEINSMKTTVYTDNYAPVDYINLF